MPVDSVAVLLFGNRLLYRACMYGILDYRLNCRYSRVTPLQLKCCHVTLVNSSMRDLIIAAVVYILPGGTCVASVWHQLGGLSISPSCVCSV